MRRAHILVVRLALDVTASVIGAMPNLQVIATSTTGLNHIDIGAAEARGIKMVSLRGRTDFLKNIPSTAEETLALLFALVRKIPWAFDAVKSFKWSPNDWIGNQLLGKKIGILGFGRLGKIVAHYAKAFGMQVLATDPFVSSREMKKYGVIKVGQDYLFKNSDFVSLHVLLTEKTHNLVRVRHLKMMKSSAFLINTARGELIEKGVLEKALHRKWIAGAAIDVMWGEKGDASHLKGNPLVQYAKKNKNLIIVPHIGGTTYEAMKVTQEFTAGLVLKYFKS